MAGEIVLSPHPDVTVPDVAAARVRARRRHAAGRPGGADRRAERPDPDLRPARRGRAAGRGRPGRPRLRQGRRVRHLLPQPPRVRPRLLRRLGRRRRSTPPSARSTPPTSSPASSPTPAPGSCSPCRPFLDKALEAAGRSGVEEVFVLGEAEGATPFADLLTAGDTPPAVDIDPASDLVVLPYSSGTTGVPKGVMLTHRNLVANLCQGAPTLLAGEGERLIAVLPFFHIYGLVVLMSLGPVAGLDPGHHAALRPRGVPRACSRTSASPGRTWPRRSCSPWPSTRWSTSTTCRRSSRSSPAPPRWTPAWSGPAPSGWAARSSRARA